MYPLINLPTPYPREYLETLYDYVKEHKPKTIVEFGSGWGSSTIVMRKAQETYCDDGELLSCESDNEKYSGAAQNFYIYGITEDIYYYNNGYEFYTNREIDFDLLYIDIHNDGERLKKILKLPYIEDKIKNKKIILFEGGSTLRNNIAIERGGTSFEDIRELYDYKLIFGTEDDRHVFSQLIN